MSSGRGASSIRERPLPRNGFHEGHHEVWRRKKKDLEIEWAFIILDGREEPLVSVIEILGKLGLPNPTLTSRVDVATSTFNI